MPDNNDHPATPFDNNVERTQDLPVADSRRRLDDMVAAGGRNQLRAMWASEGVKAYALRTGLLTDEEPETAIGDLITDTRHLCDALGLDFEELLQRSGRRYNEERRGEDGY